MLESGFCFSRTRIQLHITPQLLQERPGRKRCQLKPHQQCFQGFAKSTVVTNRIAVPSSQRQGTATPSSTSFSHQTPSIAFAFADCKGSIRSHLLNHWSSEYVNLQYLASEALMGQWQSKQNDRRYIQRGDVYDTPST